MTERRRNSGLATRRQFLTAAAATPALTGAGAALARTPDPASLIAQDLERYIAFGEKRSGGAGDNACGVWMEQALAELGFETQRQTFSAPVFEPEACTLSCNGAVANLWAQPIVVPTPQQGLTAPLVRVDSHGQASHPLSGAIALVDLAHARWSSMFWPGVAAPVRAAFEGGARACVIITNGPTDKIIALNTDGREPLYDAPMALLAPEDAAPFLAAAHGGSSARLMLAGVSARRPAFNLMGRLDRGMGRWLVVSTPRSGWFTCAGERGGGVAAFLHMARWATANAPGHDLLFVCNSGHEYQYLGAEELLREHAPPPEQTAFWLHLGANFAARDWHDSVGGLQPLPGTDSQRYLVVSPSLLPAARANFSGLSGLEAPYSSDDLSAGELSNVLAAGYTQVAGIFGVHRFHHVRDDDARCVSANAVAETSFAFQRLLEQAVR
jgi:hypothetical protein